MSLAAPSNEEVARVLAELAFFLEMDEVEFKPRAYGLAADAVAGLAQPLGPLYRSGGVKAIESIPSVGKGIAKRIVELLETGRCSELDALREARPIDVLALSTVAGLGPKQIKSLFDGLHVGTLDDLERAAREGRIRALPRFGARSEERILRGLQFVRETQGRRPLGHVLEGALALEARMRELPHVARAQLAGSLRRRRETVRNIDLLIASAHPDAVTAAFVALPEVAHVHARADGGARVRLRSGIDADLRIVAEAEWGAALCLYTGSSAHCAALQRSAAERGLQLNERGLFRAETHVAGREEEELYAALGLPWMAPELREDRGENAAALDGTLPALIPYGALKGDLQTQTSWTDGEHSMEEMALAAKALGLQYIAITDHTRDLMVARGNDEARLLEQLAAIRALDARIDGIRVLAGAEVNIRRDGTLDIADEVLAQLDVVGVGVHSALSLPAREMTRRVIRALENPHVDILFHPTNRRLARRPPSELDLEAVFAAALRTGTVLEIDGHPGRLDLKDEHARRALQLGLKLVISSDAHSIEGLRYANDFGIAVARRAWARKEDVLNTRPVEELLAALK